MIFGSEGGMFGDDKLEGEPFLVPLAIPFLAGPSTLAALLLLERSAPGHTGALLVALTIAWAISAGILLSSTFFYRILRERGLVAMERLMGMLLVMVSVQMLLNGIRTFLTR
jgi:multiple antibiotic resistance protein